ncbi:DUF3224 domain-containing protein [Teredinibacter waterburyi]|uniref:DUF3224 domain-containing protein n=1 Tax=Teredinibacter waterburyi TaxID=1500538 RepID=UPI001CAA89C0|nr:DUF3224 domain-containing protein [Teredinibacter waterburyi]
MINILKIFMVLVLVLISMKILAENNQQELGMSATGTFEVKLDPQNDEGVPAGRMVIHKEYTGGLVGKGVGQMISKRTEGGAAVYSAIEEFEGSVNGKTGSFTLFHNGFMSASKQSLEVIIVEGSGAGELKGITGSLDIIQENGKHSYVLEYQQ